jgi:putative hydrolase of the HAD superfamily
LPQIIDANSTIAFLAARLHGLAFFLESRMPTAASAFMAAQEGMGPVALSASPKAPARVRDTSTRQSFEHVDTWIFDLDDTLYPASCNLFSQVSRRIGEYVAKSLGVPFEHARHLQLAYYRQFGTTLAGLMQIHNLPPAPFLEYVYDIDLTSVSASPELKAAIARLPGRRLIFTNGSKRHAENVARRLGVLELFDDICDIAALEYVPKPEREAYDRLLKLHAVTASQSAMFEDFPHNLEVASSLGMTTVLVCPDHIDHPAQAKIREWRELPVHIHYMTDNLEKFLANEISVGAC